MFHNKKEEARLQSAVDELTVQLSAKSGALAGKVAECEATAAALKSATAQVKVLQGECESVKGAAAKAEARNRELAARCAASEARAAQLQQLYEADSAAWSARCDENEAAYARRDAQRVAEAAALRQQLAEERESSAAAAAEHEAKALSAEFAARTVTADYEARLAALVAEVAAATASAEAAAAEAAAATAAAEAAAAAAAAAAATAAAEAAASEIAAEPSPADEAEGSARGDFSASALELAINEEAEAAGSKAAVVATQTSPQGQGSPAQGSQPGSPSSARPPTSRAKSSASSPTSASAASAASAAAAAVAAAAASTTISAAAAAAAAAGPCSPGSQLGGESTPSGAGSPQPKGQRKLASELGAAKQQCAVLERRVAELEEMLQDKLRELVDQGEKNYQLYDKIQALKVQEGAAEKELAHVRELIIKEIAGPAAEAAAYKNVPSEELLRVLAKAHALDNAPTLHGGEHAISGASKRRPVRSSNSAGAGTTSCSASSGACDAGPCDAGEQDETAADEAAAAAAAGGLTRLEAMQLTAEVRLLKQANRRLQQKSDEAEQVERSGLAALESMAVLKKRSEDLAARLRREKDMRARSEAELQKAADKIQALTQHIEKLMVHLKHEAAAKTIAGQEVTNYKQEAALLRARNTALAKKNKSRDKALEELREGSRILEDQLRLMDQKYVQLRAKLDWTRVTSGREVKKIQNEANKLRASFALAFSQASSDGSAIGAFKGLLGGEDEDEDEDDEDDEEEGDGEGEGSDEDADDQDEEAQQDADDDDEAKGDLDDAERTPAAPKHKAATPKGPSAQPFAASKFGNNLAADESLPAIESIIPAGAERYKPRA